MSSVDLSKISVLLVEDEVFMANIVTRTLREIGVLDIFDTRDGEEGLKALMDPRTRVDVVLLDLNIPKVTGRDVLKFIRNSDELAKKDLPVIVMTGNAEEGTVREILALNVSGYLVKPVSKKDLTLRLIKALAPTT